MDTMDRALKLVERIGSACAGEEADASLIAAALYLGREAGMAQSSYSLSELFEFATLSCAAQREAATVAEAKTDVHQRAVNR